MGTLHLLMSPTVSVLPFLVVFSQLPELFPCSQQEIFFTQEQTSPFVTLIIASQLSIEEQNSLLQRRG